MEMEKVHFNGVRACPSCSSPAFEVLCSSNVTDFAESSFSGDLQWVSCNDCGFVFNNNLPWSEYLSYYQEISTYNSKTSFGTGGVTNFDLQRYGWYLSLLQHLNLNKQAKIVDVGCGKGGLINFLSEQGYTSVHGLEIDPRLVTQAKELSLNVEIGTAEELEHHFTGIELVCLSHVLEHIYDLKSVLEALSKSISDEGLVFIEVPDASNYLSERVFDCFWLNMREHINHFSPQTLSALFAAYGFEPIFCEQRAMSYGNELSYPSLLMCFTPTSVKSKNILPEICTKKPLKQVVTEYVKSEFASIEIANSMYREADREQRVAIWGLAIEFFAHYSYTDLKLLNIVEFVDSSGAKLGKTIDKRKVKHPEQVNWNRIDVLYVYSSFRYREIVQAAKTLGFQGKILVITK